MKTNISLKTCDRGEYYARSQPIKRQQIDMTFNNKLYILNFTYTKSTLPLELGV